MHLQLLLLFQPLTIIGILVGPVAGILRLTHLPHILLKPGTPVPIASMGVFWHFRANKLLLWHRFAGGFLTWLLLLPAIVALVGVLGLLEVWEARAGGGGSGTLSFLQLPLVRPLHLLLMSRWKVIVVRGDVGRRLRPPSKGRRVLRQLWLRLLVPLLLEGLPATRGKQVIALVSLFLSFLKFVAKSWWLVVILYRAFSLIVQQVLLEWIFWAQAALIDWNVYLRAHSTASLPPRLTRKLSHLLLFLCNNIQYLGLGGDGEGAPGLVEATDLISLATLRPATLARQPQHLQKARVLRIFDQWVVGLVAWEHLFVGVAGDALLQSPIRAPFFLRKLDSYLFIILSHISRERGRHAVVGGWILLLFNEILRQRIRGVHNLVMGAQKLLLFEAVAGSALVLHRHIGVDVSILLNLGFPGTYFSINW